jgi:cytochrome c-type biogenesis protein CcmH
VIRTPAPAPHPTPGTPVLAGGCPGALPVSTGRGSTPASNPSPRERGEREGPAPRAWEGEGRAQRWIARARILLAASLLVLLTISMPAHAVRPDEMLPDPAVEARARDIGKELRCLVCRNQSIDDSDADLAHDIRVLVRQRLAAGDSDAQVIAYIRSRYGDYVLLKPPFQLDTWLLWGGPALILLAGLWVAGRYLRRQARMTGAPLLSADEAQRLAEMLDDKAEP